MSRLVVALDTATEVTSVGLAWFDGGRAEMIASASEDAPRAAMSRVLPMLDALLSGNGLIPADIAEVVVGRGPGSFTGVRIGVATAKGLAQGLGVGLVGVGTLDAIAWGFAAEEILLGVVGDAMRGEVYPALFRCGHGHVERLGEDRVAKPAEAAAEWAALDEPIVLAGNGLRKYADVFSAALGDECSLADESLWRPGPQGLFDAYAALSAETRAAALAGGPGALLPIYTRLSDAEENEAARAAGDAFDACQRRGGRRCLVSGIVVRDMLAEDVPAVWVIEHASFPDPVDSAGVRRRARRSGPGLRGRRGGRVGAHRGLCRRHGGRCRRAPHEPRSRCGVEGRGHRATSCSGPRASARSSWARRASRWRCAAATKPRSRCTARRDSWRSACGPGTTREAWTP